MKKEKISLCAVTTISKTMDWFVGDIMKKLSENGYNITLVCDMEEGFAQRHSHYARCVDLKMKRGASISDLLSMPLKLCTFFRKNKFDVIYYMSPNASMYASLGGLMAGIPVRIYSQTGIRYVSFSGIKRKIFRLIEKLTCLCSTHIKSQSPKNMQFAVDEKLCIPEKISLVGIGGTTGVAISSCDSFNHMEERQRRRRQYSIPTDAFVYGYVGRVNTDKGIGELIQAFERVQQTTPNAWLVLVGIIDEANPISADLMARAHRNQHIVFTGNVAPAEVYQHMSMFDVLTHPTYREGFGKVLQEAMGMRLPIITTNIPGPSEVVEDGVSGILVKVRDPDSLASAMGMLYQDSALRERLAVSGRKRAEQYFDRPIMLENQLQSFNHILEV